MSSALILINDFPPMYIYIESIRVRFRVYEMANQQEMLVGRFCELGIREVN